MAGTITVFRKEILDHFGSKRYLIVFGLIVILSALSAYQGVDYIKEYTEQGFLSIFSGTKTDFSFIQLMVFFGPLLGLIMGFDAINKEWTSGTLSVVLSNPIFRDSIINGKFLAGVVALATLILSTIGIMCSITIPLLGYGPTLTETSSIIVLSSVTVLYLAFWLGLGTLFSVLTKKISTSMLASVATWIFFSILVGILSTAIANMLVPIPALDKESPNLREIWAQNAALQSTIAKISPTALYEETASAVLGTVYQFGRIKIPYTLTEALTAHWANIATIAVGLVVCFVISYMKFLRSEIRPGG